MEKDGYRARQLSTSDTPRQEVERENSRIRRRFLNQPKCSDYYRFLSIKPPADLEEETREQVAQYSGPPMFRKALLRALVEELEEESAKLEAVRLSFTTCRQQHTSVKLEDSLIFADSRSYLQSTGQSASSQSVVAQETSQIVTELSSRLKNLLEFSEMKNHRLKFKAKAIQTEIEIRVTAIKSKKDQVKKLQNEIVELSSKVTDKPTSTGMGSGSMSSYYLQKLLTVTQDRSGNKKSHVNLSLNSANKESPKQIRSFLQPKSANVFGKSSILTASPLVSALKLDRSRHGDTGNKLAEATQAGKLPPKLSVQSQEAYGLSPFHLSRTKTQISPEGSKKQGMAALNKSYTLGISPDSENGKPPKKLNKSGHGDYSFVEGSSKSKQPTETESDPGVIDKFSKWIKRIGPKY